MDSKEEALQGNERFKIIQKNHKEYIFDSIRKKYVVLTPEEWVRQNTIYYLVHSKNYPPNLIRIEQKLKGKDQFFRSDIVVYSRNGEAKMIVECKAEKVKITQDVFDQISKYNLQFNVDYLVVTNGLMHYTCKMDYKNKSYTFLKELPEYDEITLK
ncbi:MAG: type I restriction enzyme HsdR N-terminal domain-containing protein [Bacteroidales bacterium]